MFLIKNDNDLLTECGFLKYDINRLSKDFKMFYWNKMKNT